MNLFQFTLMTLTCAGSLCMNLGPRWKKFGVLLGISASPLWILSAFQHGEMGMVIASTWIWGAYFIGAWTVRADLLHLLGFYPVTKLTWHGGFCTSEIIGWSWPRKKTIHIDCRSEDPVAFAKRLGPNFIPPKYHRHFLGHKGREG